jgi:hypothetical protein
MDWYKCGAIALVASTVCFISCASRKRVAVPGLIPTVSVIEKQDPRRPSNGIYLEGVKVYDEAALEGLLNGAKSNLAQLNAFDQTSLIGHLGAIQGSTANQSQNTLQMTGPPQWGAATPTTPNTPNNPALPTPAATYTLPSTFQTSAVDFLNEQMQLSMQMINLQLLLSGSFNDQFERDSNIARRRTTLGFPININVPEGFRYQGAVAEVEITVCAPDTVSSADLVSNGGLSLVTLLPQEKTYNVASLVSKTSSIAGGAVAGVVNVGGGLLRSRQTYYLVQDQDTIAAQRFAQYSCDQKKERRAVTFAWQFRPVLGEKVVRDGLRQTYAQVSFPQDVSTLLRNSLPIQVRTGWRHYDRKTGRVGTEIDPFETHYLKADRFDIRPSPLNVQASDNGDGTVTVLAMGAFKAGSRVRIGGVVQDNTAPGFEQNQRYLRFMAPASSLALYDARLLYPDGVEALVINPDPILPGPPSITSLDRPAARPGDVISRLAIIGSNTHFTKGIPNVWFSNPSVTTSRTTVIDDTHLGVTLAVLPTAPLGPCDVTVVTQGETAVGAHLFMVRNGNPGATIQPFNDSTSLVSLQLPPAPAIRYSKSELEVVLIGSHLFGLRDAPFYNQSDDEIQLLVPNDLIRTNRRIVWKRLFTRDSQDYSVAFPPPPPTGISDFTITGVTLVAYTAGSPSSTPAGTLKASDVTVSMPSQTASGSGLFMIGDGVPAISSISKPGAQPGETLRQVVITGAFTHFTNAAPAIIFSNSGISARNLSVIDSTHLRADLTVTPGAAKGASSVTVRNGSEVAIGVGLFNVGSGTALVTSVNPASADLSQAVNVAIVGASSHFVQGQSAVKLSKAGVVASNVVVADPTHLTATFTIAANAMAGSSTVTVATDKDTAVGTDLFTVAPNRPSIVRIVPAAGQQGQTVPGVVITGAFTHFTQGTPAVTFNNQGITATNVVVVDDTHLTVTLNIMPNAAATASAISDPSSAAQKPTNTYAISGSRLAGLRMLVPAGVPIEGSDTLATFSFTDDQAKAYKSIVVQHNTEQPIVVTLPAAPAAPTAGATSPKPSCKRPATGITIGSPSVTVNGTGMSQVVGVRYLDTPLPWTSSSDTTLTIQQLPTLVPPGIELTFILGDRSMTSCFIPVQALGQN